MMTHRSLKSLRQMLVGSTAIIGGMIAITPAAHAQALPDTGAGNVTVTSGTAVITTGSATVDVNLQTNRTIIEWGGTGFNIGLGNSVTFTNGVSGTPNIAVLNRDVGVTSSVINGLLTSDPSVAVYLINSNGILFGAASTVTVGSLFASTLDLADADFLGTDGTPNDFNFTTTAGALTGVTIDGSAGTITTSGATGLGQLVLLGATVSAGTGTTLTGVTDAAFVAAADVTMTAQAGSPLSFTIARGTPVATAITANGTVAGRNITLAFATQSGVANALLSVGGTLDATTATATNRGIVLAAGVNASGVLLVPADAMATNGSASVQVSGALNSAAPLTRVTARNSASFTNAFALTTDLSVLSILDSINFANTVNGAFALTTTGATTLGGLVGGTTALTSLSVTGTTAINGGGVTTTGLQNYTGAVTLGANTTLSSTGGGAISFGSTVDSDATARALTVTTTGLTTFGGLVGNGAALTSLTVNGTNGTTAINGGGVTTSGLQSYTGAVTLGANTTLTSTGGGAISFGNSVDSDATQRMLTVTTTGLTTFGGLVGSGTALASLTVNGTNGTTAINGGGVTTSGLQSYTGGVTLGANTTLTSTGGGAISFGSTVDSDATARALTVTTAGLTTFGGLVGGTAALTSLTVNGTNGTTAINGGGVTTTGLQNYTGAVTLGANTTLTSTGGGAISFGSSVDSDATARALTVTTTGLTTFGGLVGGTAALTSLTVNGTNGTTAINGGGVTTTGLQSYTGAVTLGANTTLSSTGGGAISFGSTVGNATARALTVTTAGLTTFGGLVGSGTALASLTVNGTNGTTAINGGGVTTSGLQSYTGGVTLGANTTLTSTGGGAISFGSMVDSDATARALTVTTAGLTTFGGLVGNGAALASLTVTGTSAINAGAVTTSGLQTYTGAVMLGANTVLTSTTTGAISFGSTVDSDATARALTVNTGGATTFTGRVGDTNALASLTTDAGGTTAINGGLGGNNRTVRTTQTQTYNDAVTLGADTLLVSSGAGALGNVTFATTVDSDATVTPRALTVNTAGLTSFGGLVGNSFALTTVLTDAAGTTLISGGVRTTQTQTYNDAVTLGADTLLASSGAGALGDVTFAMTVDSDAMVTPRALTVNTAGATTFTGLVGDTNALASLTVNGTSAINGGAVTTTGLQNYTGAVTLGANTTLTSTGGGAISFGSTVDSDATARALTVNTVGTTTFSGLVGDTNALTSLTSLGVTGTTAINGGGVTTSGAQSYGGAVTLGAAAALSGTTIGFASSVDGPGGLTTTGLTTFGGRVGNGTALASLTVNDTSTINTDIVRTSGLQTYTGAVTLGSDAALTSTTTGTISFGSTVDSDATARALTVNTGGATTFTGRVGDTNALASLTTDAGGTTAINGGLGGNNRTVRTTQTQTYNDAVTLGADTLLVSSGAGALGNVTFATTVDSDATVTPRALTVNTAGLTSFGGLVGNSFALTSVLTDTAGTTRISGGVQTTETQTYNDAVTLGADTLLASSGAGALGDVTFAMTVDSDALVTPRALTVNTAGTTTFLGMVGNSFALKSVLTDAAGTTLISGGLVQTTQTQTYNDAVTLGADTLLVSSGAGALGNVTFATTVDSDITARALTVNTVGLTSFGGLVGDGSALRTLTTDAGGSTAINGGPGTGNGTVRTTETQTYNDAVTLGADTLVLSLGAGALGDVTFATTVDSDITARALTVNTVGLTSFGGLVGDGSALRTLTTDGPGFTAGGATLFSGGPGTGNGTVRTTETQTYNDAVALGADTLLLSLGTGALGDVTFATTVDSNTTARALTVNTVGLTSFGGLVGDGSALRMLTTDGPGFTAGGATLFSGGPGTGNGTVRTTETQTYNDAVTLGADTLLLSLGTGALGNVTFATTVDSDTSARALTVNTVGLTSFGGLVGDGSALRMLTTDGPGFTAGGATLFSGGPGTGNGTVRTIETQTYNDAVALGADTLLLSLGAGALGDVTFATTVDSDTSARALTVNTVGLTSFGGLVGDGSALRTLTTDGPGFTAGGTTLFSGGLGTSNRTVRTTQTQTYNDAVTLGADARLIAGGDVVFTKTVGGSAGVFRNLSIDSNGSIRFDDVVDVVDLALRAGGSVIAGTINARDDIAIRATGGVTVGALTSGFPTAAETGPTGTADDLLAGIDLTGHDIDISGSSITTGRLMAIGVGSDIRLNGPLGSIGLDIDLDAGGNIALGGGTAQARDVALRADGSVTTGTILARDDIAIRAGAAVQTGSLASGTTITGGLGPVDAAGSADVLLAGVTLTGADIDIRGASVDVAAATANNAMSDLRLLATTGDLFLGTGVVGDLATLTKQSAGSGELRVTNSLLAAGDIAITSATNARLAGGDAARFIRSQTGNIVVNATGAVTGTLLGTPLVDITDLRADGAYGAADLFAVTAGRDVTVTSIAGLVQLGAITAGRDVRVTAAGAASISEDVIAGRDFVVQGASVALGGDGNAETQSAANRVVITATNGSITGGANLTLRSNAGGVADTARTATLNLDATNGDIGFASTSVLRGGISNQSAVGINLRTAGRALTLGTVRASELRAVNAALTDYSAPLSTSGQITLVDILTTQAIDIRTSAGSIRAGTIESLAGGVMLTARDAITGLIGQGAAGFSDPTAGRTIIAARATGSDILINAGGLAQLGTVEAARNVTLGDATNGASAVDVATARATQGALRVTANTGSLIVGTGTAGTTIDLVKRGATGNLQVTTSTASGGATTMTSTTNAVIARADAGAALSISALSSNAVDGNLTLGQGGGATTTTLDASNLATLAGAGTVYAAGTAGNVAGSASPVSSNALRITARDATVSGTLRAFGISLVARDGVGAAANSNSLRIGDGPQGSAGFDLSTAELNRMQATNLTLDAGARTVQTGTVAFNAAAGTSRIDVLTTGRISVTGGVSLGGAGRTLRLGGAADTPSVSAASASSIRVQATGSGGGRIVLTDANLDLRANRISVGQRSFLDALDGISSVTDVTTRFSANPQSALYSATLGGEPYANPILIRAGTLTVRYGDFALFQNTGLAGTSTGVQVNNLSAPALGLSGSGSTASNSFALFGTINGMDGNAAALLGPNAIATTAINLNNARINGCLIGSGGGGCLITATTTPTTSVFDPTQLSILRAANNLALTFDALVGTGNEALFSDLGSVDPFVGDRQDEEDEEDEEAKRDAARGAEPAPDAPKAGAPK